jgi:3-methyladenine DNA glycosylase AlkC
MWSLHPDAHVRRLASEGCRPRLPWAMAVPFLKKDPSPILPILNNLKADSSEYVRRSVANNLNDISKDHPELLLQIAQNWKGYSPDTDKLLKHASRTLIKSGNLPILQLFGFGEKQAVEGYSIELNKQVFYLNETVEFSFSCIALKPAEVRLQYVIDFAKKNVKRGRKVFYLDEKALTAGEAYTVRRKVKMQNYTTRTLYEGRHTIGIMLNGEIKAEASFHLHIHPQPVCL